MADHKHEHHFQEGTKEVIFRTGDAPKVENPKNKEYTGQITAPYDYTKQKEIDWPGALLTVNISVGQLVFYSSVHNPFGVTTVVGTLRESKIITKFGVNAEKKYGSKELAKAIKMNLFYFADQAEAKKVIIALNKFEAKVSTTIEDHKDVRGNMKNLLEKAVDTNIPSQIIFKAPILEGQPAIEFAVEICAESTSNSVEFYLESPDLLMILEQEKERIIGLEVAKFADMNCPTIYL